MTAIKSSQAYFQDHRQAALWLLANGMKPGCAVSHKEAGFLGHLCVSPEVTDKQAKWLTVILERNTSGGNGDEVAA
jgi:hypothetical protein